MRLQPRLSTIGSARAILLTCATACGMTVLDANVVGVILPTVARELGASFADIEWVISAYVLCFASLLLPAGSIADRYGRKPVLLIGLTVFALASLACALAPTASALYAARAVQGVGAAFLLAPALAIIGHTFHEEHARARAWATWGGIMGLTMVTAPLVGGALNAWPGWRWAFAINVPISLLLGWAIVRLVPSSRSATPRPLDITGIACFSGTIFFLTWALISGPQHGWHSAAFLWRLATGLGLGTLFIAVEKCQASPMLELSLFRSAGFVAAVAAMFAYAAAAQVMASLLPLFLQNARGVAATYAGLAMLPFAVAMLVLPQVGRVLARRLSSSAILALGLSITALGNLLLAFAADGHGTALTVLGMAILGSGGGLLNGETQKAIMGNVPPERAGMASGISTTSRFTGVLAGFAGLGAVLAEGTRSALQAPLALVDRQGAVAGDFIRRTLAGDMHGAAALLPGQAKMAEGMARTAYSAGFAHAFLAAAIVAACAAAVVIWSIIRAQRPTLASPAEAAPLQKTPQS